VILADCSYSPISRYMLVHNGSSVIQTGSHCRVIVLAGGTLTCSQPNDIGQWMTVWVQTGGVVTESCLGAYSVIYYDTTASLVGPSNAGLAACNPQSNSYQSEGCQCPVGGPVTPHSLQPTSCTLQCHNGGRPDLQCSACYDCDHALWNVSDSCATCVSGISCVQGSLSSSCSCVCDSGWTGAACDLSVCSISVTSAFIPVRLSGYSTTRSSTAFVVYSGASLSKSNSYSTIVVRSGGAIACTTPGSIGAYSTVYAEAGSTIHTTCIGSYGVVFFNSTSQLVVSGSGLSPCNYQSRSSVPEGCACDVTAPDLGPTGTCTLACDHGGQPTIGCTSCFNCDSSVWNTPDGCRTCNTNIPCLHGTVDPIDCSCDCDAGWTGTACASSVCNVSVSSAFIPVWSQGYASTQSSRNYLVHPGASLVASNRYATIVVYSGGTVTCSRYEAIDRYSIVYAMPGSTVNTSCISEYSVIYYSTTSQLTGTRQLSTCNYNTRTYQSEGCVCNVSTTFAMNSSCQLHCFNGGRPNVDCSACYDCDHNRWNASDSCATCNNDVPCIHGTVTASQGCSCVCDDMWLGSACDQSVCSVSVAASSYYPVWSQEFTTTRSSQYMVVQANASVLGSSSHLTAVVLSGGTATCTTPGGLGSYGVFYLAPGATLNQSCLGYYSVVYSNATASVIGAAPPSSPNGLSVCDWSNRLVQPEGCVCDVEVRGLIPATCQLQCSHGGRPNAGCTACYNCDSTRWNVSDNCASCRVNIPCAHGSLNADTCQCICGPGWSGSACAMSVCNLTTSSLAFYPVVVAGYTTTDSNRFMVVRSGASVSQAGVYSSIVLLSGASLTCTHPSTIGSYATIYAQRGSLVNTSCISRYSVV
jgi:hypothetical protein